jgi:hypothetical protein
MESEARKWSIAVSRQEGGKQARHFLSHRVAAPAATDSCMPTGVFFILHQQTDAEITVYVLIRLVQGCRTREISADTAHYVPVHICSHFTKLRRCNPYACADGLHTFFAAWYSEFAFEFMCTCSKAMLIYGVLYVGETCSLTLREEQGAQENIWTEEG